MNVDVISINNAIQVHVRNLHAANDPTTAIIDATLAYTIYKDSDDTAVTGGENIAMPHDSDGNYFGNCTPTLVDGLRYYVVVTCSNYTAEWTRYFNARIRPFD